MSYKFGEKSLKKLKTIHPYLQLILNEVIKHIDITIIEGQRNEVKQNNYYNAGKSKLRFPNSKHNKEPYSLAVDIAPYPINWEDTKGFYLLAGIVYGVSQKLGIPIRWGGAWNGIDKYKDNSFNDLVHFELDN